MTDVRKRIIRALAGEACAKIVDRVVEQLEKQPAALSGDDSGLASVWEEFCVQVQDEESFDWESYVETVKGFIGGEIGKLSRHEREAIWLQTDGGWDWLWDLDNSENPQAGAAVNVPCDDTESAAYVYSQYLLPRAEDFSSDAIDAYLDAAQRGRYDMAPS